MPRKLAEPFVKWNLNIPATLAARVEMRYYDPTHQKPRYAERSKLVTRLLVEWVEAEEAKARRRA
jgi:hypothetical protein